MKRSEVKTAVKKVAPKQDQMTRFDARVSKEQKELFERAAVLTGRRSLTDFVISSAQKEADKIIEKYNTILASRKDQQVFFNAIMNPPKPNAQLKKALAEYNKALPK